MFDLKKRTRIIFAAGLIAALGAAPAASAQELKIGVVNVQALLQQAPQTKASMEALQEEFRAALCDDLNASRRATCAATRSWASCSVSCYSRSTPMRARTATTSSSATA